MEGADNFENASNGELMIEGNTFSNSDLLLNAEINGKDLVINKDFRIAQAEFGDGEDINLRLQSAFLSEKC